jgi:hypothetical protein
MKSGCAVSTKIKVKRNANMQRKVTYLKTFNQL